MRAWDRTGACRIHESIHEDLGGNDSGDVTMQCSRYTALHAMHAGIDVSHRRDIRFEGFSGDVSRWLKGYYFIYLENAYVMQGRGTAVVEKVMSKG